jgi:hypothetical protein
MQERTCSDSFKINRLSGAAAYKEKLLVTGLITSALQSVYTGKEMAKVFVCGRRYSRILALFFV